MSQLEFSPAMLEAQPPHAHRGHPFLVSHRAKRLALKREYEALAMVRVMTKRLTGPAEVDWTDRHGLDVNDERDKGYLLLALPNGSSVVVSFWRYRDAVRRLGWRVARDLAANSTYYQERWPIG